ncbi:MAG TPA: class I SAM-dependent methyltransferase [Anaerolineales bacterium]|nr:class I SAM-dependent methyltransferase [Anaerolineales bacterium]
MKFICPRCQSELRFEAPNQLICDKEAVTFHQVDGIWRFLLPERESHYARFIADYEAVRRFEGRFSADASYYRALPFQDLTRRFSSDWQIRAKSYTALTRFLPRNATILDLGAGNGWLSNRLTRNGHEVYAVDLLVNSEDGLGAWTNYETKFIPLQAEFTVLPFSTAVVDVVIFNASLHYAESYEQTLAEALRVLKRNGLLVVMDSPVYRNVESGRAMLAERKAQFLARYGFASDALQSEGFLTYDRMRVLGQGLGIRWRHKVPFYGARWALRPIVAWLRGRREPAQFGLWLGNRNDSVAYI